MRLYDEGGAATGPPATLVANGLPSSASPLGTGGALVVWSMTGGNGSNEVFAQFLNADGELSGESFVVNSYTQEGQNQPDSCCFADGRCIVVWTSQDQDGSYEGVYAQRFSANGETDGSEFRVNVTTNWGQTAPSVGCSGLGTYAVAWRSDNQNGSSYDVYARTYGEDGQPVSGEFPLNTYLWEKQEAASTAGFANGSFITMWTSFGQDGSLWGVFAQRYDGTGIKIPH